MTLPQRLFLSLTIPSLLSLSLLGCTPKRPAPTGVHVPMDQVPLARLSDYRLFQGNGASQKPSEEVLPYDLNSPLFSDYTKKRRFLWIPKNTQIQYKASGAFEFPKGAVLIKTFSMPADLRDPAKGETLLETRLLIHQSEGWRAYTYVWNKEQTEAQLEIAGESMNLSWIHSDGKPRENHYIIPNLNDCKSCHSLNKSFTPIGPAAKHLNRDFPYPSGPKNQLDHWSQIGLLKGAPSASSAPKMLAWDDDKASLEQRARAYLDINCAHCHNPAGLGSNSGLDLRSEQRDPVKLGVMKAPVAAGRGSGGLLYDIVPGHPEKSILTYRMASTEAGIAMPELGRGQNHKEGIELISNWIQSLTKKNH